MGGVKTLTFDLTTDILTSDQTGIALTAGLELRGIPEEREHQARPPDACQGGCNAQTLQDGFSGNKTAFVADPENRKGSAVARLD